MKLTLAGYEKKTINSSGGVFTVMSTTGLVELSAKGLEDIPLESSDQINIGDRPKITLQNMTNEQVVIDFVITSTSIGKKAQVTRTEIINTSPIEVHFDEAFTIGAVAQQGAWNIGVLSAQINTHKPRVECLAGAATKLFSAGIRKSNRINIRSDQFNGVSLGGSNLVNDSSGGFLDVGMVDYMDTSGELWAFNNGTSSVFVDVLELV
jgi:hypothetical protein